MLTLLAGVACSDDRPDAAPAPSPSPSPSAAPERHRGTSFLLGPPEVTCPGPSRPAFIIAKRGPQEPPYPKTPEEALAQFLEQNRASRDEGPLYDVANFERIPHYDRGSSKPQQRRNSVRFAGYRPNTSVFLIVRFSRSGVERSWLRQEVNFCFDYRGDA